MTADGKFEAGDYVLCTHISRTARGRVTHVDEDGWLMLDWFDEMPVRFEEGYQGWSPWDPYCFQLLSAVDILALVE